MCPVSIVHVCPGSSGINLKCCIITCNGYSPAGSVGYNHDVYLSLSFQNKETNNQTVEQGAFVAEEEVKLSSALSSPILILTFLTQTQLIFSAILIHPILIVIIHPIIFTLTETDILVDLKVWKTFLCRQQLN